MSQFDYSLLTQRRGERRDSQSIQRFENSPRFLLAPTLHVGGDFCARLPPGILRGGQVSAMRTKTKKGHYPNLESEENKTAIHWLKVGAKR